MNVYNQRMTVPRDELLKTWNNAWSEGLWAAPWSKVLDDLTPQQAAFVPQPDRHSIWQIIDHMMYWRDVAVRRAAGQKIPDDEYKTRNFRSTPAATSQMLTDLRTRWQASHEQVRKAIADVTSNLEKLSPLPYHDSYHIGQVMYLRAMQGLKAIE